MSKYIITFTKNGYIKYTSHLDMVRLFERVFKRADIRLAYSHGFNPHPKMVFAQPLSLGYTAEAELLEIETKEFYETGDLLKEISERMPLGIGITSVEQLPDTVMNQAIHTVASLVEAADFTIEIPVPAPLSKDVTELCEEFMAQSSILVMKKQKKKKYEMKEVDIRPLILAIEGFEDFARNLDTGEVDNKIILKTKLAQGSHGNLSPELLLPPFLAFAGIETERSDIEICRNRLILADFALTPI